MTDTKKPKPSITGSTLMEILEENYSIYKESHVFKMPKELADLIEFHNNKEENLKKIKKTVIAYQNYVAFLVSVGKDEEKKEEGDSVLWFLSQSPLNEKTQKALRKFNVPFRQGTGKENWELVKLIREYKASVFEILFLLEKDSLENTEGLLDTGEA